MSKSKNDLFIVILFSIVWVVRPISHDEMPSRHTIGSQEIQTIRNKSSSFSFQKRCSNLEDFVFPKADELELL